MYDNVGNSSTPPPEPKRDSRPSVEPVQIWVPDFRCPSPEFPQKPAKKTP